MVSGNKHQSEWSDRFHNGPARKEIDRSDLNNVIDSFGLYEEGTLDGPEPWSQERKERADDAWLKRVMG